MRKKARFSALLLLIFISSWFYAAADVQAQVPVARPAVELILDHKATDSDYKNFRKAGDVFKASPQAPPSREGLSTLRESGSSEFSRKGLMEIKNKIPASRIMIVDLREESHGFINDEPVSWKGGHNDANRGLSLEEIINDEQWRLKEARKHDPSIKRAYTEEELCRELGLDYVRVPVTDFSRPSDSQVDRFVAMVQTLDKDLWLHFHCKAGAGRTTTFMTMVDMMHNAWKVSRDDILQRQFLLGGVDLLAGEKTPDAWNASLTAARQAFIKRFYDYCRACGSGFKTSWSAWQRKN
jgi:hypothetical protein